MKNDLPSPELLRKLLRYDPETGELFWRERPREMFQDNRAFNTWNSRYSEKLAFTNNAHGYRQGSIFGRKYLAHRVAWALSTGVWPENQIDHINGNKADNKIKNLRAATPQENSRNAKRPRTNASGVTGVYWEKRRGMWLAQITINKKGKHIGYFSSLQDATDARKKAEAKYGFHKNHGRAHAMTERMWEDG